MFFLILLMASCSFNNEHTWANLYVYTAKSTTLPTWSPTQKSRVTSATLVAKATTVQLTSRSTGLGSTPQVWPSANTTFFPARFCFFDNRKIPHQIDPERFSRLVQSSCEKSRWKIFLLVVAKLDTRRWWKTDLRRLWEDIPLPWDLQKTPSEPHLCLALHFVWKDLQLAV